MSRFELYGGNRCTKCINFVPAQDDMCETPRCNFGDNVGQCWYGKMWKRRPDDINWDRRCKWFQPKENE